MNSPSSNHGWLLIDPDPFNQANIPIAYFRSSETALDLTAVDHYKEYALQPEPVFLPPLDLNDPFGFSTVDLANLGKLGVPVVKAIDPDLPSGTPIRPNEHLTWYEFIDPQPLRRLEVTNQFGTQNWRVRDGRFLLVPAIKDGIGIIELNQHRKCYDAVTRFDPNVIVNLADQFHFENDVLVGPGRYLCKPVDKNFEGPPPLPEEHLACYEIFDSPLGRFHSFEDQFGLNPLLLVEAPEVLCLPSLKYLPEPRTLFSLGAGWTLLGWLNERKKRRANRI